MTTIDSGLDRDGIKARLGATVDREQIRTSEARESRLESASRRRTRDWGLRLSIDPEHPSAHHKHNADGPSEIVITGAEQPQPVTALDGEEWDYVVQRTMGLHEDGHALYTASEDKNQRLKDQSPGHRGAAKDIWNSLEDGAIEAQLTQRWPNYYEYLRVLRANLFDEHNGGIPDLEKGGVIFPLAHATSAVCLDTWMHEVYDLDPDLRSTLLDPDDDSMHFATEDDRDRFVNKILPEIDAVVPDVLTTADGVDRNRRIFEFIDDILTWIVAGDADGLSQQNNDDSEATGGMPDDASNGDRSGAQELADELEDIDPDDIEIDPDADGDPDDAIPLDDVDLPDDIREEIEDEVAEARQAAAGGTDDMLDELDEISSALGDAEAIDEIEMPDDEHEANEQVYETARLNATSLARVLENRLSQERKSETRRGQPRGRFTGRGGSVTRAARGSKRVKERVDEPDEKDYHFMIVVDRSTSMSGQIEKAVEAVGTIALALEDVGAEVSIVELYRSKARLAKPFGVDVDRRKGGVFHTSVSGGTPLTDAVSLARERLEREGENSYLVCITDGQPASSTPPFDEVIQKASVPTIGINIGEPNEAGEKALDQYSRSMVTDEEASGLQQRLEQVLNEAMF